MHQPVHQRQQLDRSYSFDESVGSWALEPLQQLISQVEKNKEVFEVLEFQLLI